MTQPLDVLLVHHSTRDRNRPIVFSAMGLLGIADVLERDGFAVQVLNLAVEQHVDPAFDIVAHARATGARIVGISLHWFFQAPDSLALAAELRRALPDALIVLGGFTASFFATELVAEHPAVDVVVRGDGEVPLRALARRFLRDGSRRFDDLPNLVLRAGDGRVASTPFAHVATAGQLSETSFANLALLRNHPAYRRMGGYPTRRFKDRFHFETDGGIFPLQVGRGCPYGCSFCGGNREAQLAINNRAKATFRSVDSVIADVRRLLEHGWRTLYVSFDPDPNGPWYPELFARIRREKLKLRLIFGSWGLPSRDFIDDFRRTFEDGMFELSPESADETLRRRAKGALAFSNADLADRIAWIEKSDLLCQVFFGYFLPGDTAKTVLETARYARRLDRGGCESFYLAFSTDPGSLLHLRPDEHDVATEVRSLRDYLTALERPRVSPNLLAHRPRGLSAREASDLVFRLNVGPVLYRVFPRCLARLAELSGGEEPVADVVDGISGALAEEVGGGGRLTVDGMARRLAAAARARMSTGELADVLEELIEYEALPYRLFEASSGPIGMHYSQSCLELQLGGEELARFVADPGVVQARRRFRFDVKRLLHEPLGSAAPQPPSPVEVTVALDRAGRYVSFYSP